MRTILGAAALAALAACSDSTTTVMSSQNDRVRSTPRLFFTVTDDPSTPGLMFTAGTVTGGLGTMTIESTRYGSVCMDEVTARDAIAADTIRLFVTFRPRAEATCLAMIRAITFHAHITGLAPGDYTVQVVQTSPDGTGVTTLTERAKVT